MSLLLLSSAGLAQAPRSSDFTLLVMPERLNLVQVGFDLLDKRPTALVAYRPDPAGLPPVLHVWTGNDWRLLEWEVYRSGSYLLRTPSRVVLVGDDVTFPTRLRQAADWGPQELRIASNQPDEVLNELGPVLGFTAAEYRWFARRYNMQIEGAASTTGERRSWYDRMTEERRPPARRQRGTPLAGLPVLEVDSESAPVSPRRIEPVPVEPAAPIRTEEAPRPAPVPAVEEAPRPAPVLRPQPAPAPMMIPAEVDATK
jgi:hypothetical protein